MRLNEFFTFLKSICFSVSWIFLKSCYYLIKLSRGDIMRRKRKSAIWHCSKVVEELWFDTILKKHSNLYCSKCGSSWWNFHKTTCHKIKDIISSLEIKYQTTCLLHVYLLHALYFLIFYIHLIFIPCSLLLSPVMAVRALLTLTWM